MSKNSFEIKPFPYPKLIAHRGASFYAPENTLGAFKLAHKMGSVAIETDIMLTKDNVPIIMHDNSLKRTTGKKLEVGHTLWKDIRNLKAGLFKNLPEYHNERVPSFTSLIDLLREIKLAANFEIKSYHNRKLSKASQKELDIRTAEKTLNVLRNNVRKKGKTAGVIFSSFSMDALQKLVDMNCEWPVAILLDSWRKDVGELVHRLKPISVNLGSRIVSAKRVKFLHGLGVKVYVYVVNKPERAKKLFEMGVDGVFSDKPDLLK